MIMRFWIGLLLGLLMGATATATYYDLLDPYAGEVSSQAANDP